jgi:hypothetical protein
MKNQKGLNMIPFCHTYSIRMSYRGMTQMLNAQWGRLILFFKQSPEPVVFLVPYSVSWFCNCLPEMCHSWNSFVHRVSFASARSNVACRTFKSSAWDYSEILERKATCILHWKTPNKYFSKLILNSRGWPSYLWLVEPGYCVIFS